MYDESGFPAPDPDPNDKLQSASRLRALRRAGLLAGTERGHSAHRTASKATPVAP